MGLQHRFATVLWCFSSVGHRQHLRAIEAAHARKHALLAIRGALRPKRLQLDHHRQRLAGRRLQLHTFPDRNALPILQQSAGSRSASWRSRTVGVLRCGPPLQSECHQIGLRMLRARTGQKHHEIPDMHMQADHLHE